MVEIVKNQPACRNGFQNVNAAGPADMLKLRIAGMKEQRDKRVESAGFILKVANGKHVVHPVCAGFDMAEQHRYIGRYPELVRLTHQLEILFSANFLGTDFAPYRFAEYLSATAGKRSETAFGKAFENLACRDILQSGDVLYFTRRKSLKVHSGELAFQPGEHAPVVNQTGCRMAAPYDMELAHFLVPELSRLLYYLLRSEEKGASFLGAALAVGAESAPVDTNVSIVDMQIIYVEDPAVVFRRIYLIGPTS